MTAVTLLSGCTAIHGGGRPQHQPGSVYQLEPLPDDALTAIVEWVRHVRSLDELVTDESAVVVAKAGTQRILVEPGLAWTITQFRVSEVLHGAVSGTEIEVLHSGPFGPAKSSLPQFVTIPKPGLEYLLIVNPRDPAYEPQVEYWVAEPGQWVREFPDQRFALDLHDYEMLHREHTVPLDTSIEEFQRLLEPFGD